MVIRGFARLVVAPTESLSTYLPDGSAAELRAPLLRMDRLCGLSVVAVARMLAEDSSLRSGAIGDEVAIVLGSAHGCHKTDEEYYRSYLQGQPSPRLFAYTLPSSPIGELSIQYRLRGPGLTVTMGRTSGLCALAEADLLLATHQAEACLVVAVEVAQPVLSPVLLQDSAVALWLTRDEDSRASRLGTVASVSDSFCAEHGSVALGRVLSSLHGASDSPIYCDEETVRIGESALHHRKLQRLSVPAGAVSGLWLLTEALHDAGEPIVVAAMDDAGHAAAALLVRSPSILRGV